MGQIVLLDPPAIFAGVWAAIQPVLDPVTKSKVVFLRGELARRAYGEVQWGAVDPGMAAWIGAVAGLPGRPGSFPPDDDEDEDRAGSIGSIAGIRSSSGGGGSGGGSLLGASSASPGRPWGLRDGFSVAELKRQRDLGALGFAPRCSAWTYALPLATVDES